MGTSVLTCISSCCISIFSSFLDFHYVHLVSFDWNDTQAVWQLILWLVVSYLVVWRCLFWQGYMCLWVSVFIYMCVYTLFQQMDALDEWEELTELGHHLTDLPVEPRLGKMVLHAVVLKCLDPILTIVCILAHKDPCKYLAVEYLYIMMLIRSWTSACYWLLFMMFLVQQSCFPLCLLTKEQPAWHGTSLPQGPSATTWPCLGHSR